MTRPRHAVLSTTLIAMGMAAAFAVLLTACIAVYWRAKGLGTAGSNGMALVIVILPMSFAILASAGGVVVFFSSRRGRSRASTLARAAITLALVTTTLFAFEWRRTSS